MRSKTLTGVVALATALAALAPSGAAARHAFAPVGGICRIGLNVEPHVINSGEQVQLYGQANCPGGAIGQTITIYSKSPGSPMKIAGTAPSGAGGFFNLVIPQNEITFDTSYFARDLALGGKSPSVKVRVAPNVSLEGPKAATLTTGRKNAVMFTGQVTPNEKAAGAVVYLQRSDALTGEDWHTIGMGTVGANGLFSIIHAFALPGDANIRVVVRPFGRFTVRAVSSTLSYGISQAQNPNLTIASSSDPITVGGSTNITGTVAGAGDKTPVTLLSHTRKTSWTVAATGTTDATGHYTFTASPTVSTQYRVTTAKASSAALFEGVRYGLTAGVSASTVEAGQSLTFTGSVTGASVGKVVYLERKDTFGDGWHVVDLGLVTGGGTYSITHAVFGFGKEIYRVKVPGDPGNQGVASSPFTIEVTAGQPKVLLRPHRQPRLPG